MYLIKVIAACLIPGQTDSQLDGSQHKFLTCVQLAFSMRFVWPTTCVGLRGLAITYDDFGRAKIRTQLPSRRKFFTQPKSTKVDRKPTVYAWNERLFATCVNLRELASRLAIRLATHRIASSPYASSGFANLCWLWTLASPFGQGFK